MSDPIRPTHRTFHCCECQAHALEVVVWRWPHDTKHDVEINFWHIGAVTSGWRNWWQRIRGAWRLLRFNTLYVESVMLMPERALELSDAIREAAGDADAKGNS